ncbi:MAG: ASCH domain-containing protein [archaeon]
MRVPVISLRQPILELILRGEKTIETRTRKVDLPKTIYLHASMGKPWDAKVDFDIHSLPRGFILGKVDVIGRKSYTSIEEWNTDKGKHLAGLSKSMPMFGYLLQNPVRIEPILCKGQLGLPFWVEINLLEKV